jgi:dienelactone hydrolase
MKLINVAVLIVLLAIYTGAHPQDIRVKDDPSKIEKEKLRVFQQWSKWNNPGSISAARFIQIASDAYSQREKEIADINSEQGWKFRQQHVRQKLKELFAPAFVFTPLNAKITGIIKKRGYRIEKLVFESSPGYFVTGCVYVPDKVNRRVPAILNLMGHNQEAFRAELYQLMNVNLALKGMIVLTIDPPGQGEMVQYYDSALNASSVGYTVIEHCYFANQCFLTGISPAIHFVRDGMRAIDYLLSRMDVDHQRIGLTGFSGGGTITTYLAALDDRIKVAIPSSWSTAAQRLVETKGTQDGETVLLGGLQHDITLEDLIEVRAPRPTMMTFVSRDQYLSVQAAREAYLESKRVYRAFGMPDNLAFVEDDYQHWMTPRIRYSIYSFFLRHFDMRVDPAEVKVDFLSIEDLRVTPTGQVSTSYSSKGVFELNKVEVLKLHTTLETSRVNNKDHLLQTVRSAKVLSAYVPSSGYTVFFNGRYHRKNYTVSKIALEREEQHPIPVLLFMPHDTSTKRGAIIYINPQGKELEAHPAGEVEKLVNKGYVVAAVDLFGIGEIKNQAIRDISIGYSSILTGKSIPGLHAEEINTVARYLRTSEQIDSNKIIGYGIEEMCLPMIHAAAFENVLKGIVLRDCPASYYQLASNKLYRISGRSHHAGNGTDPPENYFSWGVAAALTQYDIPDLLAAVAPRAILMINPRDHMFQISSRDEMGKLLAYPTRIHNSATRFKVMLLPNAVADTNFNTSELVFEFFK